MRYVLIIHPKILMSELVVEQLQLVDRLLNQSILFTLFDKRKHEIAHRRKHRFFRHVFKWIGDAALPHLLPDVVHLGLRCSGNHESFFIRTDDGFRTIIK